MKCERSWIFLSIDLNYPWTTWWKAWERAQSCKWNRILPLWRSALVGFDNPDDSWSFRICPLNHFSDNLDFQKFSLTFWLVDGDDDSCLFQHKLSCLKSLSVKAGHSEWVGNLNWDLAVLWFGNMSLQMDSCSIFVNFAWTPLALFLAQGKGSSWA